MVDLKMGIEFFDMGPEFSFRYVVDFSNSFTYNQSKMLEIKQWADDCKIDCVVVSTRAYLDNEQHANWFILRWSQ